MFSASFCASKLILPTTAWTMPPASLRNSTLPALYSRTVLADFGRDGAGTRRRHQPARTEHAPQRTDHAHHVGSGDAGVELGPAVLDLLGQLVAADFIGPGGLGLLGQVSLGEHDHPQRLADAVRQHDRAADQLIGLLGIDAQPHRDVDRLIELRVVELLEQGHGLVDRQRRVAGRLFRPCPAFAWKALP